MESSGFQGSISQTGVTWSFVLAHNLDENSCVSAVYNIRYKRTETGKTNSKPLTYTQFIEHPFL